MRITPGKLLNVGVALAFALTFTLSGRGAASAHHASATMRTLRLNYLTRAVPWTQTLDPAFDGDQIDFFLDELWAGGLVKMNTSGKVVPDLATWRVAKNHRVYWFTLRAKDRFSNGDRVTAADVVWSFKRALSKATNSALAPVYFGDIIGAKAFNAGKAASIKGIKILNPREIQISLDRPIQEFLFQMTYPTGMVLDRRVDGGHPPNTYMTRTCSADVGTGPFRFVCRNKGTGLSSFYKAGTSASMTFEPNPYYYGRKPHIRLYIPTIATDETQYNEYQAGGLDITTVPSEFVARSRSAIKVPLIGNEYLTPNVASAPFNNENCRLAVAYAIDRETLATKVLKGTTFASYAVVPKGLAGWYPGADNPHYNPSLAKSYLSKCPGHLNGLVLPYQHTTTDYDNEYSAIQQMLQAVGINVKLKPLTHNDWLNIVVAASMNSTKTAIVQDDYYDDYPDPQDYCTLLLRSGAPDDIGQFNNAQYNRLVDQAEVTANPAQRAALYRQAQHIALSTGSYISLRQFEEFFLVKPSVHGFVASPVYNNMWPRNDDWANVSVGR